MTDKSLTRRQFVGTTAGVLAASFLPGDTIARKRSAPPKHATILFQGDSVTDNFRSRTITAANIDRALGTGYPFLVASEALARHPDRDLHFLNRGISGNKIPDLAARWQSDTLELKPDILSVLIGVNDFWHTMLNGYTGTLQDYENGYMTLLEQTRNALPNVKFVVLEPFALRGKFVDDRWYPAFSRYQAASRRVAQRMGATFVPLQHVFDERSARTGPLYWTADGVHPTPAGHALIADRWRDAVDI